MNFHTGKRISTFASSTLVGLTLTNAAIQPLFDLGTGEGYEFDSLFHGGLLGILITNAVISDFRKMSAWFSAWDRIALRYRGVTIDDQSYILPNLYAKAGVNYTSINDTGVDHIPGYTFSLNRIWQTSGYFCTSTALSYFNRKFKLHDKKVFGAWRSLAEEDINYNVSFIDVSFAPGIEKQLAPWKWLGFFTGITISTPIIDNSKTNRERLRDYVNYDEKIVGIDYTRCDECSRIEPFLNITCSLQYGHSDFIFEAQYKQVIGGTRFFYGYAVSDQKERELKNRNCSVS